MPPHSDLFSPFPLSAQALLLGVALLVAALLVMGWIVWRLRARLRRADQQAVELRTQLMAAQAQPPEAISAQNPHEALFRSLMADMPGVAYRCTPDDHWSVVFISDAIETPSGWTPADYYTSHSLLRALVHVDDQAMVDQQIQAAVAQGSRYTMEYRGMRRDGSEFWAWEQGHGVRNASGDVLWLDGVIMDISDRKALEIALHESKQRADVAITAKATFLSNVGHEVRTPLNAIIGFSELVLKTSLDAEQREHVYKARQAALTLLKLVSDILDMAKLERGMLELNASDFSVQELAHEALQAQRAAADKKGLLLQLDADPALGECFRGDAARLRQVLDKLLDNAVKFTERGTVRLELGMQDGQLLLAVHDTGIGIAPELQAKLFEAFTQADPSMSRRHGGTGLGATIAQQLVAGMKGTLSVTSAPGAGSSFRVRVPLAPVLPTASPEPPDLPHPRAPADAPAAPPPSESIALESSVRAALRQAIKALRSGDHPDATLPELLQLLHVQGLTAQASQVEHALAVFDLDLAAELLETLPAPL